MTSRERQTSGSLSAALVDLPNGETSPYPLLSAALAPPARTEHEECWDDVFAGIASTEQKQLISLARRQGLLNECPLPCVRLQSAENGDRSAALRFQLLTNLVNGEVESIQPVSPKPVQLIDKALDEFQTDAVSKALATPDVSLIQGCAGAGKSRVAAEIVLQAASRGDRVLIVAQTALAIERILESLSGQDSVYAFRCLGSQESPEHLPRISGAFTFAQRSRILRQRSIECARQTQEETRQRLSRHPVEKAVWPRLHVLAEQLSRLLHERTAVDGALAAVTDEAAREVQEVLSDGGNARSDASEEAKAYLSPLRSARLQYLERKERIEQTCLELSSRQSEVQTQLTEAAAAVEALRPLVHALTKRQWWRPAWWRAVWRGDVPAMADFAQSRYDSLLGAADDVAAKLAASRSEQHDAERRFHELADRLLREEIARRQQHLSRRKQTISEKLIPLDTEWTELTCQLQNETDRPSGVSPEAVWEAQQRWEKRCAQEEEKQHFLNQWLDYIEEFSDMLASRLPRLANVVAATVESLRSDKHFGDLQSHQLFDLLVVEEAHLISEPELLEMARRAGRWVLIGEPAWVRTDLKRQERRKHDSKGSYRYADRVGKTPAPIGCFQKLWDQLHCAPTQLPYKWYTHEERLCCRLRPVPAGCRQYIEKETVADRPDIELHILALPKQEPVLAEVLFPASITLQQAKRYIFEELQEVTISASAPQLFWSETEESFRLQLEKGCTADNGQTIMLQEGVLERVVSHSGSSGKRGQPLVKTVALEFVKNRGWTLARAKQWVEEHLDWRDWGRTTQLQRLHRMSTPLALQLNRVFYPRNLPQENGQIDAPDRGPSAAPLMKEGIEFVAVPSVDSSHHKIPTRQTGAAPKPDSSSSHAAGAGLEEELGSRKSLQHLPADLRGCLPNVGVINYREARAVVAKLKELINDESLTQASQTLASSCPAVAVLAMYPSQVELIRQLVQRSSELSGCGLRIEVDLPDAFRHRECLVALVSLTRSHVRRAVSYGPSCESLPLALTRARRRLILFADPGTLLRRSQWRGPLDHFDEHSASLERYWIEQLLRHLPS